MSALANHAFIKMNGLGNEILILDLRDGTPLPTPEEARAIHRSGLTFDQLMTLEPGRGTDFSTTILNNDGSESAACGNGTRCIAWLLMNETGKDRLTIATKAGPLVATSGSAPHTITVDMGLPRFGWKDIPLSRDAGDARAIDFEPAPGLSAPSVVNVGNPHAIFWVDDIAAYDFATLGPKIEHDPIFPERANISLAHVTAPDALTLKVWERGAGLTRACGTAACAAAVTAARTNRTGRSVTVTLPGGPLHIQWRDDDHILMTGSIESEFEGRFDPAIFAGTAA